MRTLSVRSAVAKVLEKVWTVQQLCQLAMTRSIKALVTVFAVIVLPKITPLF